MRTIRRMRKAHHSSITIQCPYPSSPPAITRSNDWVRSDGAQMDKDNKKNTSCLKNYLDYAPKIVLSLTLHSLQKPLTKKGKIKLEQKTEKLLTEKLLTPSRPAQCTSTQYFDQNGEPLLYYFGRCLVCPEDKKWVDICFCFPFSSRGVHIGQNIKVSVKDQYKDQSIGDVERVPGLDKSVRLVCDGLSIHLPAVSQMLIGLGV